MNDLLSLRGGEPLSVAVTVTGYGPAASPNPGAALTFPLVALVVVSVTNVGPAAFVNVKALPSVSDPVMTCSAVPPSFTVMLLTAFSEGARFTLFTVIVNDLLSLNGGEPLSVAVTVDE